MPFHLAAQPRRLHSIPAAKRALGDISTTTFYGLVKARGIKLVHIGRRSFMTDNALGKLVDELVAEAEDEA